MTIGIIVWLIVGFVSTIVITIYDHCTGKNIYVDDILPAILLILIGPIGFLFILCYFYSVFMKKYGGRILISGKPRHKLH